MQTIEIPEWAYDLWMRTEHPSAVSYVGKCSQGSGRGYLTPGDRMSESYLVAWLGARVFDLTRCIASVSK